MASSDGVHKKLLRSNDAIAAYKCNLMDKKDILEPFRVKYAWYFKKRYTLEQPKKKNFDNIMEMTSVWTNASQME